MTSDFVFDAIPLALGTVGGIVFIVAPFTRRTRAAGSRLFRTALLFTGITTVTWGVLGLLDKPLHSHLSKHGHYLLHHYKDMCSGASLSVLLILFYLVSFGWSSDVTDSLEWMQSIAELLTQDGSELRRPVSSRNVGGDLTLERSEQMPKYLDR